MSTSPPLHVRTPLIESVPLSQLAGCKVYLKLENTQPSASFKLRGIGHKIQKAVSRGCTRLVASSGGNAGFAAAYAARKLGTPITIYIPESTPQFAKDRLLAEGAEVVVHGAVWDKADEKAREEGSKPGCGYIHPFDDPEVWEGHESLAAELAQDLPSPPGLVVVSVGGGGLLAGVAQGMDSQGWASVPILVMETLGADSFSQAIQAGRLVTLPDITSVAKSLGALTVAQKALDCYKSRPIISETIGDKQCIEALVRFLDDHRMLVEPACSASLAAVYSHVIPRLLAEKKLVKLDSVVIIVCGGGCVTPDQLNAWKQKFNL